MATTTRRRPTPETMGQAIATATRHLQEDLRTDQPRVVVACAARHAALTVLLAFPPAMSVGEVISALNTSILPPE